MGCALVSGVRANAGAGSAPAAAQLGEVLLCTINSPLFGAHRSDCHAEANAIAASAARGFALRGVSCYVTRAPCVNCYKLLASAGIARIIAPNAMDSSDCVASASELGIECIAVRDSDERAQRRERFPPARARVDLRVTGPRHGVCVATRREHVLEQGETEQLHAVVHAERRARRKGGLRVQCKKGGASREQLSWVKRLQTSFVNDVNGVNEKFLAKRLQTAHTMHIHLAQK